MRKPAGETDTPRAAPRIANAKPADRIMPAGGSQPTGLLDQVVANPCGSGARAAMGLVNALGIIAAHAPLPQKRGGEALGRSCGSGRSAAIGVWR